MYGNCGRTSSGYVPCDARYIVVFLVWYSMLASDIVTYSVVSCIVMEILPTLVIVDSCQLFVQGWDQLCASKLLHERIVLKPPSLFTWWPFLVSGPSLPVLILTQDKYKKAPAVG